MRATDGIQRPAARRPRRQRSDSEKLSIVQQVLASSNRTAELRKLGIYPAQFYSWLHQHGAPLACRVEAARQSSACGSVMAEARALLMRKPVLLQELRRQREQLDHLIGEVGGLNDLHGCPAAPPSMSPE